MALNAEQKGEIVGKYGRGENDTGSPEVQVALLSARINELTEHFPSINMIITRVVAWCVWSTHAENCWTT